jgi:choline dehydrogenase-like flavoprotein
MTNNHFDIIIIGTGIGGGTIAQSLATTGKKILILERGGFIPKEKENWDPVEVVEKGRYRTKEKWFDKDNNAFEPFTHYAVGGNSKVYGAAAFRMREKDFTAYQTPAGISPAWPLSYTDFKPYYDQAEIFMKVHGIRNEDPTEPFTDTAYPFPPIPVEPFTKELFDNVKSTGVKAYPIPMAVSLTEDNGKQDAPMVLGNFDGFPDPTESKSDAHILGIRPALKNTNVTLLTNAMVHKLETDSIGKAVSKVHVAVCGEMTVFACDIIIIGAGAVNSAALLLRTTSIHHPNGLGNNNNLVGRNYMSHINGCMIAYTPNKLNDAAFQKYFCIGDYYWGDKEYEYPLGEIQLMGKNDPATYAWNPPSVFVGKDTNYIAQHAIDFWLTSEDIPLPQNRVALTSKNEIQLIYHRDKNNVQSFEFLKQKLKHIMTEVGKIDKDLAEIIWGGYDLGISGVSHQCGTLTFGDDKNTSVLNTNCQLHEVPNVFVVDASFFPSCGSYNPSLTIAANSLRVADYIKSIL